MDKYLQNMKIDNRNFRKNRDSLTIYYNFKIYDMLLFQAY